MKVVYFFKPNVSTKNFYADSLIDVFNDALHNRIVMVPGVMKNSVICKGWKKIGTWKIKSNF